MSARSHIHTAMISMGTLACLTLALHQAPPRLTNAEIIDALAVVMDGDYVAETHLYPAPVYTPKNTLVGMIKNPPVPKKKPAFDSVGNATDEQRMAFNALIERVMEERGYVTDY